MYNGKVHLIHLNAMKLDCRDNLFSVSHLPKKDLAQKCTSNRSVKHEFNKKYSNDHHLITKCILPFENAVYE